MKTKKPFYTRWWFILIVILIIILAIGSMGDDETTEDVVTTDTDTNDNKKDSDQKEKDKQEAKSNDSKIKEGMYKVGTEIPAGEYLVIVNSLMGYIEGAKDSTGSLDSIIFNDNLFSDSHSYVTLQDGEFFKLQGAEMYPLAEAPSIVPEDGVYRNGMYRVGEDLPAGEYKVTLDSESSLGYLEVSSNSRHTLDSIVTNENLQADMYITVKDGQYLKLQDAYIDTNKQ